MLPYVDPKCFNVDVNQSQKYKLNKKSDVYSIRVLMWQITSGREPFYRANYDIGLALEIVNGKREGIIDGNPIEYSNLYESK